MGAFDNLKNLFSISDDDVDNSTTKKESNVKQVALLDLAADNFSENNIDNSQTGYTYNTNNSKQIADNSVQSYVYNIVVGSTGTDITTKKDLSTEGNLTNKPNFDTPTKFGNPAFEQSSGLDLQPILILGGVAGAGYLIFKKKKGRK